MSRIEVLYTRSLLDSLCESPLLVGDLAEAPAWDAVLEVGGEYPVLNFEQKLGHLYEDALELLIRGSAGYELLAKNLQVEDGDGRTLGELDFLLRDLTNGEFWHIELAVKFYLAILDTEGFERYPGPDPRDNWINKLEHLRERQLRLCQRSDTRRLLRERFGVTDLRVGQRIYGIIFDRLGQEKESSPPAVSPLCRRGKWLPVSDWGKRFPDTEKVKLVPKCLWPALLDEALIAALEWVSVEDLKSLARERCVLFWDAGRGIVVFLVPDEWPGF